MSTKQRGGKFPPGVRPRGQGIQIDFQYDGSRRREITPGKPDAKGLEAASIKRQQIQNEIKLGTFDYSYHFPHSQYVAESTEAALFQTYVERFISTVDATKSTKTSYVRYANRHVLPTLGQRPIGSINATDLLAWRAELLESVSTKTVNNIMVVVRQAMKLARADGLISVNPAAELKNLKLRRAKSQADPFSLDEIATLRHAAEDAWMVNLIDLWWTTGMRTGELLALTWECIDTFDETIDVHRSHVGGEVLIPKDQEYRTIALYSLGREALDKQRKLVSDAPTDFVFIDPRTRCPFMDSKELGELLKPLIERCDVRYRRQYNLRHSYASYALSAGEPALAVRDQLGHETLEMLERHYSKSMLKRNKRQWQGFEDVIADARAKFGN